MASKKYAYYIQGNKIALVQVDDATDSLTTSEYGKYKSPVIDATDGLEVQYTYAPIYEQLYSGGYDTELRDVALGYTSYNGNLMIIVNDKDYLASDYNTYGAVGTYIKISKSGAWNGIHKIKERWDNALVLETKLPQDGFWFDNSVSPTTDETFTGAVDASENLTVGDWVGFVGNATTAVANNSVNGFTQVSAVSGTTVTVNNGLTAALTEGTTLTETEAVPTFVSGDSGSNVFLFKAVKDTMIIDLYITAMEDESFKLDLPHSLSLGVVNYLKARMMEDAGDFERKEYFMREFRRIIEKHNSAKSKSIFVVQGFNTIIN